ncbi:hypothetical protein WUBG_14598 [Wuchereria bancrofti]|nr:hypothetical protein WUBG_14598 [Wuchereria bancrofti]
MQLDDFGDRRADGSTSGVVFPDFTSPPPFIHYPLSQHIYKYSRNWEGIRHHITIFKYDDIAYQSITFATNYFLLTEAALDTDFIAPTTYLLNYINSGYLNKKTSLMVKDPSFFKGIQKAI